MEDRNGERNRTRRNVLRSAASIGGLGATVLFSTGTGTAHSTGGDSHGYEITDAGYLEYTGRRDDAHISQAVAGMNTARKEGRIDFTRRDGQVVVQPEQTVSTAASCPGVNSYSNSVQWNGVKHVVKLDHCTTRDLVDALIAGAAIAQVAAIISAAVGNVPAAAVSECAAVLIAAGWQIIDNNDEGQGVKIVFFIPNVVGVPGIDPQ